MGGKGAGNGQAEVLFLRALSAHRQGLFVEAECLYRAALEADPGHADAMHNLGTLLVKAGKLQEALPLLERAAALKPQSSAHRENLANTYRLLGRRRDAAAQYKQALALDPGRVSLLRKTVEILLETRRPDEVEAILTEALARAPRFALGHQLLSLVFFLQDRMDEALAEIEEAIALEPDNAVHYRMLSDIKRFGPGDPHIAAMQELHKHIGQASRYERVCLGFALAKAYTDSGEQDRAFAQLLETNALVRTGMRYDENKIFALFARMKSVFTAQFLRRAQGGDPGNVPIIILGMLRSGTTLSEQILASHPKVKSVGELQLFDEAVRTVLPRFPDGVDDIDAAALKAIAGTYLTSLREFADGAERIIDKFLFNVLHAGLIHMAFPNARFVHLVRDPVDTCLSCFATHFTAGQPYAYDLGELGRYYRAYEDLMAHWHGVFPPGTMLKMRYEELVSDPKGQIVRLLEHCALPWDDACLSFDKQRHFVMSASTAQVRRPIYRSSVGRWRPAAALLRPLIEGLGNLGDIILDVPTTRD